MAEIELNGQDVVNAVVGDDILIRLDENASTGFVWTIDITGTAVALTADARLVSPNAPPGSAAQRVFTLSATAPGDADVLLRLAREWAPTSPAEERRVRVTVQR